MPNASLAQPLWHKCDKRDSVSHENMLQLGLEIHARTQACYNEVITTLLLHPTAISCYFFGGFGPDVVGPLGTGLFFSSFLLRFSSSRLLCSRDSFK